MRGRPGRSASHGGGGSTGFDRSRIDVRLLPVAVVLWGERSISDRLCRSRVDYVCLGGMGRCHARPGGAVARRSPSRAAQGNVGARSCGWIGCSIRVHGVGRLRTPTRCCRGCASSLAAGLRSYGCAPVDEPVRTLAQQHASVRLTAAIAEPPRLSRRQPLAPAWSAGTHPPARNWSARSTVTEIREGSESGRLAFPCCSWGADSSDYLRLLTPRRHRHRRCFAESNGSRSRERGRRAHSWLTAGTQRRRRGSARRRM